MVESRRLLRAVIVGFLLLWATCAHAALAIDNRASSASSLTSPITTSFTVNAVSPLLVAVLWQSTQTISSVTWNGTGLTALATKPDGSSANNVAIYGLKNPGTGTHNVVVTFSADPSSGAQAFIIGTTGGDTTTSWRTIFTRNDGTGVGPGTTVTDSQNGDIVFHGAVVFATSITWNAGETTTSTTANNIVGSAFSGGMSTKAAVGANTSVGATNVATYAEIAFAVIPASGGVTCTPTLTLLGVGCGEH